jgi:anti-sigma regulatory factor (Ser/Thr protein kinase)
MIEIDEQGRLAALARYRILDTEPEPAFDDLTLLASQICDTPIALITLVDEDRQWFKSRVGISLQETSRSIAFCAHAIQHDAIMVVSDAAGDDRFRQNPCVVGEPHIRFYAGAPLVTPDGHALGTLCVVDSVPRALTAEQVQALDALRHQAVSQLELRRNLIELECALAERDRAQAEQSTLLGELRDSLDNINKLSALMPFSDTCKINLIVPAVPTSIDTVADGVIALLRGKQWSEDEVAKVDLALREALANGIRHGCHGDPSKNVQCIVNADAAGEVTIVVRDPGPGFDPSAVADPIAGENVFKGSGRGVFLINHLMDEVAYADGGRELQMRKQRESK